MNKTHTYDERDPYSIAEYAKQLEDKTLKEFLDVSAMKKLRKALNDENKGNYGGVIEKYFFQITPGNKPIPDFPKAKVELKTSPLKVINGQYFIKERLVLGMIDYYGIIKEKWKESSFYQKNSLLLLIFYCYERGEPFIDFLIKLTGLWQMPPEDEEVIKDDWLKIKGKIESGLAHELSEGDTIYLGACTKASNSYVRTPQPIKRFMEDAKPRAFSFKVKYMNYVFASLMNKKMELEDHDRIIKDSREYNNGKTFEQVVVGKFDQFVGMTTDKIAVKFGLRAKLNAKNYNDILTRLILGIKKKKIEEFEKGDVVLKSITLENNGNLKESISFPYFKFNDLVEERKWEDSSMNEMFRKKFFLVIYQKKSGNKKILKKVMFWNMPYSDLEEASWVWKRTKKMILTNRLKELPKISEHRIAHVRPHGRNRGDTCETPNGARFTKQAFWLNAKYMLSQIEAHERA